jgi:hypothetical protein
VDEWFPPFADFVPKLGSWASARGS